MEQIDWRLKLTLPLQQTAPEILAALAVIGVYALFWIAVTGVVLSRWPRGSGAISVLVTIWPKKQRSR